VLSLSDKMKIIDLVIKEKNCMPIGRMFNNAGIVSSVFHRHHHQFSSKEKQDSKPFLKRERERALSHTVQYFKYFYYSKVLYYCYNYCTKQYSILLLAIFANVLIFIIFKLNCILSMYEY
jgi:hypothetical protein